jgi:hypothetical protein
MLAAEEGKNDDLRAQLAASEAGAAALREAAKLCLADDADGPVLAARLLALEAALNSSSAGTGWVRAEVVDEGRRLVAYAECSHCGKKYGDPTDCIEAHCIEAHAWLAALAPLKAK